jgi:signal transduction histidine kinase
MKSDVTRLENLVTEVLDTASLESGRRRLAKQPVRLAETARAVVAELADRAPPPPASRSSHGSARSSPSTPIRSRCARCCANLLDNALRATAANGGGRILLAAEASGGEVRLRVADDGVGFPPEEAPRLFQKFYRPGDELRRTGPGTGLGLYIVERLMELERGAVHAESAGPGRGATFTVAWPAHAGGERA